MNFRPGLKLWSTNTDLLPEAALLVQNGPFEYIELMPVPGTSVEPFVQYDIPFVLHCATERFGVNIADTTITYYNLQVIDECLEWADVLGAEYVILHPGFGEIDNALAFLQNITDRRIIIENMPKVGLQGEQLIGYSVDHMRILLGAGEFGFCLDLNHAAKAAISMNVNYKQFIQKMMTFNPVMFHISDGSLNNGLDEHLAIGEGDYDMKFFSDMIGVQKVTVETPRKSGFNDDLTNLSCFIQ